MEVANVVKRYKSVTAVGKASFGVPKGSLFGLLGPNGAGKTSLIRMITAITLPDDGYISINGQRVVQRLPEIIGYLPEERGLYKKMKVGEHLLYLAQLKGLSLSEAKAQTSEWLDRMDASSWFNRKIEELSKGMQQKIQFIATVLTKPQLLILDEPFSGLDPVNTNLIKEEIRRLNKEGVTVIFSTHRMEQVEEICERIALIDQGRTILEGRVEDIKKDFRKKEFKIETLESLENFDFGNGVIVSSTANGIQFRTEDDEGANKVLRTLIEQGKHITYFAEVLPTLNEIFIQLVTEENSEA